MAPLDRAPLRLLLPPGGLSRDPETGFVRRPQGARRWTRLGRAAAARPQCLHRRQLPVIANQQLAVIDGALTIRQGGAIFALHGGDCLRWGPPQDVTFENDSTALCRYIVAVLRATA